MTVKGVKGVRNILKKTAIPCRNFSTSPLTVKLNIAADSSKLEPETAGKTTTLKKNLKKPIQSVPVAAANKSATKAPTGIVLKMSE